MAYEFFYPGTPYSLEPGYGEFVGYKEQFRNFALTTDPRTANQIQEVSAKLNPGGKVIEVSAISPEIFESIPQQHLKEINRLSKLTGTETTIHGPLIEASGYSKEGWSEVDRQNAERQMKSAIERSHELSPDGNIPVTFHSTAMLPEALEKVKLKVGGEWKEVPKSMLIVEPRTGQIKQLRETERFFPGEEEKFNPEKELNKVNRDTWTESIGNINFTAFRGLESIREAERAPEIKLKDIGMEREKIKEITTNLSEAYTRWTKQPDLIEREIPELTKDLSENEREDLKQALKENIEHNFRVREHAQIFLRDSYRGLRELFNMVYKEANPEDKKKLNEYKEEITPKISEGIERRPEKLKEFSEIIEKGIKVLNSVENPKIFKPLNEFVIDKSAQTFANTAFHGFEEFGNKAPIVAIENPPVGGGLSRAEDLKKLIEEARKEFVKKAREEGYGEGEARDAAEKLIGATWDVGHINMLRKYGYDKADIVKQTEKIAPFVKKVHLSDNFGFEHTELPMGMGNVPVKEIMEKLGKEGFEGKKIIEAAAWWQHFKTPPLVPTLEAFGSPLYPMLAQPSWNQIASTYGNYFAGYGTFLPEQHFSIYGAGFSSLPTELGGQVPGKQARMGGAPME